MKDVNQILQRIKFLANKINDLELSYNKPGKIRGRAYQKKILNLREQIEISINKLGKLGCEGILYRVICKNNQEIFFTNITTDIIKDLITLKYPDLIIQSINKIPLGEPRDI